MPGFYASLLPEGEEMKISIVVPTYEERDNLKPLVERIGRTIRDRNYAIVLADDNSPDGTAEAAASLLQQYPIKLIGRDGKLGNSVSAASSSATEPASPPATIGPAIPPAFGARACLTDIERPFLQ